MVKNNINIPLWRTKHKNNAFIIKRITFFFVTSYFINLYSCIGGDF
jgi:hypothetical protein